MELKCQINQRSQKRKQNCEKQNVTFFENLKIKKKNRPDGNDAEHVKTMSTASLKQTMIPILLYVLLVPTPYQFSKAIHASNQDLAIPYPLGF